MLGPVRRRSPFTADVKISSRVSAAGLGEGLTDAASFDETAGVADGEDAAVGDEMEADVCLSDGGASVRVPQATSTRPASMAAHVVFTTPTLLLETAAVLRRDVAIAKVL